MADELPNPESRKETYLAKAAGMSIEELPTPASREELYLNAIAENGGGGGGGTNNFNQLTNRPKYNSTTMTGSTNIPKVPTKTSELSNDSGFVTSGSLATVATTGAYSDLSGTPTLPTVNDATLTITQNGVSAGTFTANDADDTTIALTDTTYSAFTGTDGTVAGTAGLVPAPATTDAGKFLKADGTWGTAGGGGGGDTVYSDKTTSNVANGGAVYIGNLDTTQTEQADPTSTDDHYKYFWALPYSNTTIPGNNSINIFGKPFSSRANNVMLGPESQAETNSIAIGLQSLAGENSISVGRMANSAEGASFNNYFSYVSIGAETRARSYGVSLGNAAKAMEDSAIAIGASTEVYQIGSVALGRGAYPTRAGEVNVGSDSTAYGYNNTIYRVIGGVHDGQSSHDAVTVEQVNATIDAINTALSTNIPHIGA